MTTGWRGSVDHMTTVWKGSVDHMTTGWRGSVHHMTTVRRGSVDHMTTPFQRSLQEKLEVVYLSQQERAKEYEQKMDALNTKNSQVCGRYTSTWISTYYACTHTTHIQVNAGSCDCMYTHTPSHVHNTTQTSEQANVV